MQRAVASMAALLLAILSCSTSVQCQVLSVACASAACEDHEAAQVTLLQTSSVVAPDAQIQGLHRGMHVGTAPANTTVLLVAHHKTGTVLLHRMLTCFKDADVYPGHDVRTWEWHNTSTLLSSDSSQKVVHMIRDPISVVVSGYNYHKRTSEIWCRVPMEPFYFNPVFLTKLNEQLGVELAPKESYQQLLNRLPEELGLAVELIRYQTHEIPEVVTAMNECKELGESCLQLCLEGFTRSSSSFKLSTVRLMEFSELHDMVDDPAVQQCLKVLDTHGDNFRQTSHMSTDGPADVARMKQTVRDLDADGSLQLLSDQSGCDQH